MVSFQGYIEVTRFLFRRKEYVSLSDNLHFRGFTDSTAFILFAEFLTLFMFQNTHVSLFQVFFIYRGRIRWILTKHLICFIQTVVQFVFRSRLRSFLVFARIWATPYTYRDSIRTLYIVWCVCILFLRPFDHNGCHYLSNWFTIYCIFTIDVRIYRNRTMIKIVKQI